MNDNMKKRNETIGFDKAMEIGTSVTSLLITAEFDDDGVIEKEMFVSINGHEAKMKLWIEK